MINDDLKLTGALTIALNDEIVQKTKNLVVTAGKNWVASRMKDTTQDAMSHMAVGTGTTQALAAQTTLVTENDRNALTSTTVTGNAIAYVATWAANDATAALTEAGIFDAASGGDMLCRTKFDVVNKGAADSMTITWTITVS
jgi:hypothetical protein|tara:strand:+ start:248 stop:673 length:426 start_codon:yes stop_codon:yes gene_type:complete